MLLSFVVLPLSMGSEAGQRGKRSGLGLGRAESFHPALKAGLPGQSPLKGLKKLNKIEINLKNLIPSVDLSKVARLLMPGG
jgi:hypothetical protein